MATKDFPNGLSFTYRVERQTNPTILRGNFWRDDKQLEEVTLETSRPTMAEAVDAIHRYAALVAPGLTKPSCE